MNRVRRTLAHWVGRLGVAVALTIAAVLGLALSPTTALATTDGHAAHHHTAPHHTAPASPPSGAAPQAQLSVWSGESSTPCCPSWTHGRMAAFCCAAAGCLAVPVGLPVCGLPPQRVGLTAATRPMGQAMPEGIGVPPDPPPPRQG
ncbi:hypothetical protein [Azospirillum griseum]|uniref:hypothetical protein n=1 Tax=Azospirillum griseum TaxID=2496639 RepID=UPI0026839583